MLALTRHQVFRDFRKQRENLVDTMKKNMNRAREMCEERLLKRDDDGVESLNEQLLEKVMSCMKEDERCVGGPGSAEERRWHHDLRRVLSWRGDGSDGWEFVVCRRGITVHRKFMPAVNGVMSKFCCVRVRAARS
jgi:hypothetical protein